MIPSLVESPGVHRNIAIALSWPKSSFGSKPLSWRDSSDRLSAAVPLTIDAAPVAFLQPFPPDSIDARSSLRCGTVSTFTTPATASEPYNAEYGPRTISTCSTPAVENRPQSYPEKYGFEIAIPFQRTSVCVELDPRVNSDVALPGEPVRLTTRPGTSRSTAATSAAARHSISSRVTTVAAAGVESTASGNADAVTTISCEMRGFCWECAGVARTSGTRQVTMILNGFTTTPPSEEADCVSAAWWQLVDRAVGLLASGSSFPRPLPARSSGGLSRDQSVGCRRLQWRGPRRHHTGFPFTVSNVN